MFLHHKNAKTPSETSEGKRILNFEQVRSQSSHGSRLTSGTKVNGDEQGGKVVKEPLVL